MTPSDQRTPDDVRRQELQLLEQVKRERDPLYYDPKAWWRFEARKKVKRNED